MGRTAPTPTPARQQRQPPSAHPRPSSGRYVPTESVSGGRCRRPSCRVRPSRRGCDGPAQYRVLGPADHCPYPRAGAAVEDGVATTPPRGVAGRASYRTCTGPVPPSLDRPVLGYVHLAGLDESFRCWVVPPDDWFRSAGFAGERFGCPLRQLRISGQSCRAIRRWGRNEHRGGDLVELAALEAVSQPMRLRVGPARRCRIITACAPRGATRAVVWVGW